MGKKQTFDKMCDHLMKFALTINLLNLWEERERQLKWRENAEKNK